MAEAITIARPYAVAVFRLAKEKKSLGTWSDELALLAGIASNEQIKAAIDSPKLNAVELEGIFLKVTEGKLSAEAINLVKVLGEYARLGLLPDIAAAFELLKAEDEGTLEAEITAAAKPTAAQVKTLVQQLEARFGKKVEAEVKLDPELIGGIKIVIGDTVIDASVRGQLQSLAYTLKG